jgi:26S proteasome regulatory subunit N10
MPLAATMIVLDNSEYMRNGNYQPTRFGALADAVTTVFQNEIDSNPENTVGVIFLASPPTTGRNDASIKLNQTSHRIAR